MRILIQNYTSVICSEPMYMAKAFELTGHDVHLWSDSQISTFDIFDSFAPDVFVTHFQFLDPDCIKYLSQNKKIELILNCTGMSADQINMIESTVEENGINCPFVFTNAGHVLPYPRPSKLRMESILPGLDVFLPPQPLPDYNIDLGVIALEPSELLDQQVENRDSYHLMKLTVSGERDKNFDMPVNILSLRGMYDKYDEIMFATPMSIIFSQLFYESVFYSNKVSFKLEEDQQPLFDQFLVSTFKEEETDNISEALKSQIKHKHTCVNRIARLCKFMKDSDTKLKLEKIGSTL